MRLQTVRAIYKNGTFIFEDQSLTPKDGTEVVITYVEGDPSEILEARAALQALYGRGEGENLVEALLESRRLDQQRDEQDCDFLSPL